METLRHIFVFVLLPAHLAAATASRGWLHTTATFYGEIYGDGSSDAACGYNTLVDESPFQGHATAVSDKFFRKGKGCGSCFQIICMYPKFCSKKPTTVVVTDECPTGGPCSDKITHFDLSGAAMTHMAKPRMDASLRTIGHLNKSMVLYRRVGCGYGGKNITFIVSKDSSGGWLSLLVTFVNRGGAITSVKIRGQTKSWRDMPRLWGANFAVSEPGQGPFSIRIRSYNNTVTAQNVIPHDWILGKRYPSRVNF